MNDTSFLLIAKVWLHPSLYHLDSQIPATNVSFLKAHLIQHSRPTTHRINFRLPSITPSLFHTRLKTFLFCKSFPPQPSFFSSGLTPWVSRTAYRYF